MTTHIAINTRRAAYEMLDSGLTVDQAQKGINTINQPSQGYYYFKDVAAFIKQTQNQGI